MVQFCEQNRKTDFFFLRMIEMDVRDAWRKIYFSLSLYNSRYKNKKKKKFEPESNNKLL